ncbi:MAG: hypothetical protein H5U14_14990 [Roseovarius sp.]|nr:hypothetical protein [Roseovarius sp.]
MDDAERQPDIHQQQQARAGIQFGAVLGLAYCWTLLFDVHQSERTATVAKTFDFAGDNWVRFALTFVGPDFDMTSEKPFDRAYMNALADYGLRHGRGGSGWVDHPPSRAGG